MLSTSESLQLLTVITHPSRLDLKLSPPGSIAKIPYTKSKDKTLPGKEVYNMYDRGLISLIYKEQAHNCRKITVQLNNAQ